MHESGRGQEPEDALQATFAEGSTPALHHLTPVRRCHGEESDERQTARMLIVFAGLPPTGKSTLARALAQARHATYLRIDTIEQTLRSLAPLAEDVGEAGYLVAYALAEA